jgi:hypothetical protein
MAQHLLMGGREFEGGLMAFLNPPHAAIAGAPLGWLADHTSLRLAFLAWCIVNVLLLIRLDYLVRLRIGAEQGETRWMITFALLAFYPVSYTLAVGQLSLLLAVSACELLRALEIERPFAAAVWLAVLSVKPQILPPLILMLAIRGYWRALGWAALIGIGLVLATAAILGPAIWFEYLRNLHALEQFFAAGTPTYMMNLRGALTRALGSNVSPGVVYAICVGAWIVAMAALALLLARRRDHDEAALRTDFAMTLAVALFFSPHLFPQDTVMWVVVLAAYWQSLRSRADDGQWFAAFALCWPLVFAVTLGLERAMAAPHLRVTPVTLLMVVALATIGRAATLRPDYYTSRT